MEEKFFFLFYDIYEDITRRTFERERKTRLRGFYGDNGSGRKGAS
jgi:hypothetical protein